MTPKERKRFETIKRMDAMIPRDASVSATENEVPHVAARMTVYTLKDGGIPADYVLLNRLRIGMDNTRKGFTQMIEREPYGLVTKGHDLYLFKRNHSSPETSQALTALGIKAKRRKGQDRGHHGDD